MKLFTRKQSSISCDEGREQPHYPLRMKILVSVSLQILLMSASMLASVYAAQGTGDKPLERRFTTDRPGVGNTAYLVPQGYVQIETGVTIQEDRTNSVPEGTGLRENDGKVRSTILAVPNNLIRIGLLEEMELRLLGGEYVYQKTRSQNQKDTFHGVSAPVVAPNCC